MSQGAFPQGNSSDGLGYDGAGSAVVRWSQRVQKLRVLFFLIHFRKSFDVCKLKTALVWFCYYLWLKIHILNFKTVLTASKGLKTTTRKNQTDCNGSLTLIAKIILLDQQYFLYKGNRPYCEDALKRINIFGNNIIKQSACVTLDLMYLVHFPH